MASDEETQKSEPSDVVLVHGVDDRAGYQVLRAREGRIEAGVMRPAEQGRPIHGDLVRLSPRAEGEALFDVEVLHEAKASAAEHAGPAQVATSDYRKGWDQIWGRKRKRDLPN